MTIEDIILQRSQRGMDVLKAHLAPDFCSAAAKKLFALERKNILLTTGFYVAGYAETDGPPGTFYFAKALRKLGFSPVILTDSFCERFFDGDTIPVVYLESGFDCEAILNQYDPVALVSIERCGENIQGDYANMRGVSIAEHTTDIDKLFDLALEKGIYTIGVGDGGNEIIVIGVDCTDTAVEYINAGKLYATVKQDGDAMGKANILMAINGALGKDWLDGTDYVMADDGFSIRIPYAKVTAEG